MSSVLEVPSQTDFVEVRQVRALDQRTLWLQFSTGEVKLLDMTARLDRGVFRALRDAEVFTEVTVIGGAPAWLDGMIDLAPETCYLEARPIATGD